MKEESNTKKFYDTYWPRNIPDYKRTKEHIVSLLPEGDFSLSLDAGCGTGVCSLALSSKVQEVISCDLSFESLTTASFLKQRLNRNNITLINGSLLTLPFKNSTFDLVLSWGVIHHTINPQKAFTELIRVLKKDGCLIVAVYLKTKVTFIHEFFRKICLKIKSQIFKKVFVKSIALVVKILELLGKKTNVRNDNIRVESQVEDWFFVPVKHFFSTQELKDIFERNNLNFEILCKQTGRLKSSSNIILRGIKRI